MREPVSRDPLLIIDTSKPEVRIENPRTLITIGRDYMLISSSMERSSTQTAPGFIKIPITSPVSSELTGPIEIKTIIETYDNAFGCALKNLYPLKSIEYFVMFAMLLPVMAGVGVLAGQMCNIKASFGAWMRLTALAITPAIIASMLMELPGMQNIFNAKTMILLGIITYFILCGAYAQPHTRGKRTRHSAMELVVSRR